MLLNSLSKKSLQFQQYPEKYFVLNAGFKLGGMFHSRANGEVKNTKVTASMRLIVEKFNDSDSVRYFLVTIVGYDKDEKNVAPFSYMGSRKNFEGYMVISSVEGEPLWAYYYKDETRRYAHLHSSVKEKGDSDYMGFSLYSQGIATKSGSYSTGEGDEWCYSCHQYVNFNSGVCSNCGANPIEIGGDDEYFFCPKCGLIIQNCTCPNLPSLCPVCGGYPCTCPVACPYCGDPYCNGECQNNPNPDPGNGGGDNGGGNDDNSNENNGNENDATTIANAALTAVNTVINSDPSGTKRARCNEGVKNAFKAVYGNSATELDNKNANTIVQHWRNSSKWESISKSQAQSYANNGWFVVAGWINPNGSGHVVVIVPGTEINGWPVCMDTGAGMRTTSQGLNYSFGRDKRNDVGYFRYK